jgi:outer membrane assembly lipoprotein YfiO
MFRSYLKIAVLAGTCLLARLPAAAADKYEWKDGAWTPVPAPAEGTAAGELSIVRDRFEAGRFAKTVKAAAAFAKKYPADAGYEEVCLLAGKAEVQRQRYWQAYQWFEKQLDQSPNGRLSDEALQQEYDVAEAFLAGKKRIALGVFRLNAMSDAVDILTGIAEHAPGTEIAARSLLRVADYHYSAGKWAEAVDAYDMFVDLFPRSDQAPYAAGKAAMATWLSFVDIPYDETPLIEAQQRFYHVTEAYPQEAERIGAEAILQQIATTRAEKLYSIAKFYERTDKPSAAQYYYRQLAERYPSTDWAAQAGEAGRPAGAPGEPDEAPPAGEAGQDNDKTAN